MAFTFFFRDQHVLERAVEHCLPLIAGRNHPRVWDAGAATGQEPYTLSILFAERMGHFAFNNLRIDATDYESTGRFAQIVRDGLYAKDELSRLPEGFLEKYFEADTHPAHVRVATRVRERVVFQQHDLLSFNEIGQGYAMIACKNVLLHFHPRDRQQVLTMFHRALAPAGLLVMEQTQEMPSEMTPLFERVIPDGQLFRKVEASA